MPRKGGTWKPPIYVGPPLNRETHESDSTRDQPHNPAKCPVCFDLDLRYIPQPNKDPNFCSIGQVARHWISSTDLAKDKRCSSCCFLKSAFDTLMNDGQLIDISPGSEISYSIAILDRDDDKPDRSSNTTNSESAAYSKDSGSLIVMMRCSVTSKGGKSDDFNEEFKTEIYTPLGAPPSSYRSIGAAGEVPTQPTAPDCAKIIKEWLSDCDQNHTICRGEWHGPNNQAEILPRRVLDLSGDKVRLIESLPGQRGHYVALSHCWGKKLLLTTTRATIQERMNGIPWDQLPKTFQDAIAITRALNIQYIWIDSLCIIQQDKLDWEQQSAVMADIYSRCYFNIATTRAGGGHEGCLGARWTIRDSLKWAAEFSRAVSRGSGSSKRPSRMRQVPVKSFRIPGVDGDVRIRLAMESSHEALQTPRWIRGHANTAPLLPRGWVYQERFLSTRTVHFHANEMVWVCNVNQRCECKSLDTNPVHGDGWSASKDQVVKLGETSRQNKKALYGLWRTIVEDVSLLDLTYESDRLPSLAGLASRFAKYLPENERYLAGLWEGDFARDLLWESGGAEQTAGPTRKREMTAPSWSWASMVWGGSESASGIKWEYETKPKLAEWAGVKTYMQDPRTRVISVKVEIDGENKYGIVKGGCVVIEGALCAVKLKNTSKSTIPLPSLANVVSVGYGTFNSLHLEYDSPQNSSEDTVYCLFIGSFSERFDHDSEPHITHQGLILKPGNGDRFQRIGHWSQHIEDWVHGKETCTKKARVHRVTII